MDGTRLFVGKEDFFTLTVLFTKEGELRVARESEVPKSELDKWEKFEIQFVLPDFGTAKGIMRNSMDFDGTNQVLNLGMFNNALMLTLAKSWNLKDQDEKDLPLNLEKLNELRPDIVRMFVELLHEKLTEEGIYEAVLLS